MPTPKCLFHASPPSTPTAASAAQAIPSSGPSKPRSASLKTMVGLQSPEGRAAGSSPSAAGEAARSPKGANSWFRWQRERDSGIELSPTASGQPQASCSPASHPPSEAQAPRPSNSPASPAAAALPPPPASPERLAQLRRDLGEGEGVSTLLQNSTDRANGLVFASEDGDATPTSHDRTSPESWRQRCRRDTFCATLDFVEALSEAAMSLTQFSREERHRALRYGLDAINQEIETASKEDVAIWFPMGSACERVLRIATKECCLLNSRDKVGVAFQHQNHINFNFNFFHFGSTHCA